MEEKGEKVNASASQMSFEARSQAAAEENASIFRLSFEERSQAEEESVNEQQTGSAKDPP